MRPLDRIDRMILDILQREGRIAISELASRVNLSTTPCSERVKRLERDGIITGYHARLNPALVDRNLLVFLEIKLSAKSEMSLTKSHEIWSKFLRFWNVT